MQTGTIDKATMTFDIAGVGETDTSILLTPTQLQLTYRDEQGRLIRFVKSIPTLTYKKILATDPRTITIGKMLAPKNNGYIAPCNGRKKPVAKSLVNVDWTNINKYESKTTYNNNVCVKIPVTLN